MRIRAIVLCDYAEIREGLLTVVSAGITRLLRDQVPAEMGVYLAMQVDVAPAERPFPHEISASVTGPSGTEVAKATVGFQVGRGGDSDPDESAVVSLPIDLRRAGVTEYGWHTITVSIDDGGPEVLRVKVAPRPAPPSAPGVRIAPPSSQRH